MNRKKPGFKLTVNKLATYTPDELLLLRGAKKTRTARATSGLPSQDLPDSLDWRTTGSHYDVTNTLL